MLLPKRASAFWEGHEIFEMFDVSEDLLGGTGKAEDAKLPGAGIIPKLCPMERVETEVMEQISSEQYRTGGHAVRELERGPLSLRSGVTAAAARDCEDTSN